MLHYSMVTDWEWVQPRSTCIRREGWQLCPMGCKHGSSIERWSSMDHV